MSHNVDENNLVQNSGIVNTDDDDALLASVQAKRIAIINNLSTSINDVPADKDDRTFLRDMMNDLTSTALKKKTIKSQDKANENREALIQGLVTGALKDIKTLGNPFQTALPVGNTADVPETFDPTFEAVPGEMDEGLHNFEYREFMSKTAHLDKDEDSE